jgi:hypothetical protein
MIDWIKTVQGIAAIIAVTIAAMVAFAAVPGSRKL